MENRKKMPKFGKKKRQMDERDVKTRENKKSS